MVAPLPGVMKYGVKLAGQKNPVNGIIFRRFLESKKEIRQRQRRHDIISMWKRLNN
jgi:hypothetical protein